MKPTKVLMLVLAVSIGLLCADPATAQHSATAQQPVCSLGHEFRANRYDPRLDSPPTEHALSIARRAAQVLCNGACGVLILRNPTAGNAAALVGPQGDAKIVYSPEFMHRIEQKYGEPAVFGIFSHEIGHVIDGRTRVSWMLDSWSQELRADGWAGCALARAGLTTAETRTALRAIAQYPSASHPAWNLRLPALESGYSQCGGSGRLPKW